MMLRTQYPNLFLLNMLPALDSIIHNKFAQRAPQYPEFFKVKKSSRAMEQTTQFSGLTQFVKVAEGAPTRYDEPVKGFDKSYIHDQYTLGFRVSTVMADDDRFGLISKTAAALGRSARETRELHHASYINLNPVGPDGVALFSASHPLFKAGGVQSNRLGVTSDLDVASMEIALTAFRKTKSPEGHLVRVKPQNLVVPPDLEWRAIELLKGTMRSDTTNNTVNAFKNRTDEGGFSSYKVYDYLTDPLKWYLWGSTEDIELRSYNREEPNTIHDLDFDTRSMKTAMWMRYSYGHSDYIGLYGAF